MEWDTIVSKARQIKEDFNKTYKCLNVDRDTKRETIGKHIKVLEGHLERLRVLFNVHYSRLTSAHKVAADAFYADVRERLISVALKKGVELKISVSLQGDTGSLVEPILEGVGISAARATDENITNTGDNLSTPNLDNMPQTPIEFLTIASRLIPEFDGRPGNLQGFISALELVDSVCDGHGAIAINLVKTKLRGTAINLLKGTEANLTQIIDSLKSNVKGESVDVISAKLMNIRQASKNAGAYIKEVEDLTKSLQSAYISDGLTPQLADNYATKAAVKAIVKNATNERVKLIMQSGRFDNLNEAVAKFVESCTEVYGQQNAVLYLNSQGNQTNYRGNNRGGYRGNNQGNSSNRGRNAYRGNDNRRYNNNNRNHRGRGNNRGSQNNNRNVRVVNDQDSGSENPDQPLRN